MSLDLPPINAEEHQKERLEELLSGFDNKELAAKQRERFDKAADKVLILKDIAEIVEERRKIRSERFFPIEAAEDGLLAEYARDSELMSLVIEEAVKQAEAEQSLGSGNVAKVVKVKKYPEYCYKVIINPEDYKTENNVKVEMELLLSAKQANKTKVQIPEPYYCLANKKTHLYVMKTLNATQLRRLFLDENIKALEKFEINGFFEELQKCLDDLHAAGIHHRDLHAGNVMVDFETGLPCLIDFGKSIQTNQNDDDAYSKEIDTTEGKGVQTWMIDNAKIKELKIDIQKILNKKGD